MKIEGPKSDEDEDEDEDGEGGVRLEEVTEGAVMESRCSKKAERDSAPPKGKKKKTRLPVVNHVTEPVDEIASRVMQADLDFRHPQATLMLWAWCVLNVAGFVESHPQFREGISEGVTKLLVNGDGTTESTADDISGPRLQDEGVESAEARKRRKKKEKWYNQMRESTNEIADRFPYQQLNYAVIHNVTAWCILNVDGFAESGMIPRHQIPSKIQEVLEEMHGPYEDGPDLSR
ncbi:hypothetical protein M409DRAFT_50894 [Zasmidium cellare ATCC 36951]|uniref:Uncharacterized protein n=1 Tax=Zasmidium cellare ATCC 36951 TaxID=1080233 RepID=A0A6A6CW86_ZASCE|nr:uncharacterized protein M409DRAFT_50894 [Zasmidium cellare ATCC 36951]KAF2171457.1 hypothetical protein M409DRAFT_50894 [Zasmidium cellare ATCC 36951]